MIGVPRLRRDGGPTGVDVPAELRDPEADAWQSVENTRAWLADHSLEVGRKLEWGPASRWEDARDAWAFANGYVRTQPMGKPAVDGNRLRDVGVPWVARTTILEYARARAEKRPGWVEPAWMTEKP